MTRRTHSEVTGSIERRPSARRTHSSDARLTPSRAGSYGGTAMTRTIRRALTGAVAAAAAAALTTTGIVASSGTGRDDDLDVIGLSSDQRLVRFEADNPRRIKEIGEINGLAGDTSLVGIDYRVQDGKLYGVGNSGGI
jgi:hypothetical protein